MPLGRGYTGHETRGRNSTFCVCGVLHMVTSAAVFGQRGVEIWNRQCLSDSKDIFCVARHGQDFVDSCFNLCFPFMHCSAHACCEPQDPRQEAASMERWKELGDVVSPHRRDGETFLFCIDGDARVGSVISNSVRGAEPDEESKNGEF